MLPRCVDGTFEHDWQDEDVTGCVRLESEQRCAICGARRLRYRSVTDTPTVRYARPVSVMQHAAAAARGGGG